MVSITDLLGKRKLSGVDYGRRTVSHGFSEGEDGQCVVFVLEGIEYMAQEDPDDGWRSYCEGIKIVKGEISNTFEPVDVICKTSEYHGDSVLEIIDVETNKEVLLIGTDYNEDWYPCCIMRYVPENLCLNVGK